MFPRNPLASGQISADAPLAPQIGFACVGGLRHAVSVPRCCPAPGVHGPCRAPSRPCAPAAIRGGRLFASSAQPAIRHRQGFAHPARSRAFVFSV